MLLSVYVLYNNSAEITSKFAVEGQKYAELCGQRHTQILERTPKALRASLPGAQSRPGAQFQRWTRALPPLTMASTSLSEAIEVSPGVVIASAPCAAPYATAFWGSLNFRKP